MTQEDEQGWSFSEENVCSSCVSDSYLKQMIRTTASVSPCSFCERRGRNSVPFNALMETIAGAVFQYYNKAVNEAGYESAEGGYFGDTFDTWDLIYDRIGAPSERDEVNQAVIDAFGMDTWCERNMYGLNGVDRYRASWEEFSQTVKHKIRYFFDEASQREFSETTPVPQMLDEVKELVQGAGLNKILPAETLICRVRTHAVKAVCDTWKALGAPPKELAVSSRMSAAGISVFYGALDLATAAVEASATLPAGGSYGLTGATWKSTRAINVVDLTELPPVPSFYQGHRYERDALAFLRDFVRIITEPVVHDGREHIDYVPTQILTEYFRHRSRLGTAPIDGVVYPTAQRPRGRSIVLFSSQSDLDPDDRFRDEPPIVRLVPDSIHRVRRRPSRPRVRRRPPRSVPRGRP